MPSPVISYPAIRYHETHGHVQVSDPDDEITKCGEVCDNVKHKPNKLGWSDRPSGGDTKPVRKVEAVTPNNLPDLIILTEKLQQELRRLSARVAELESNTLIEEVAGIAVLAESTAAKVTAIEETINRHPTPQVNKK